MESELEPTLLEKINDDVRWVLDNIESSKISSLIKLEDLIIYSRHNEIIIMFGRTGWLEVSTNFYSSNELTLDHLDEEIQEKLESLYNMYLGL